jgi:hypothetical protein
MAEANPIVALQTAVRDQQEWLPVLTIGEKQYSQSIFTVGGEVKAASSGKGGPAASSFGGGLDALGGGDETPADAPGHLIAEWLEFEIRVPGQPSTTIRRDVFDLLPGSFRTTQPVASPVFGETARLARGLAMLGTIQLLPVAARLTPQFIENEVVEGHRANRQALADLRSAAVAGDMAALEKSLSGFRPVSDPLLSLALGRFAWSPVAADVYLSQPNILAYRTKLSIDQTGRLASRQGFDIVANEVAVRWGSPALPFAVRLTQGATDTNLEALLVDGRMGNAGTMLDGTLAKEGSWITLRGPGDLKLASGLPEDQRRRIEQTLASGYLAVIPRATASGDSAWWRVHPTRGDALGIGTDGWGQGLTEALIQKSVVAVLTAFVAGFLCSAIACMATSSSFELSSGRFTPNANTASEAASCVCVGVGVGALAGGLILPFLKMSSGMAIGAAAIGRTASLEASLRTFQVGAGALMTLIRMARDTVCSFGGT